MLKKLFAKILIILTILIVSLLLFSIFFPFDIKKQSKQILSKASIDSIEIEKASLNLPGKFKFNNLTIQNRLSRTHTFNLSTEKLKGNFRPLYTYSNRKALLNNLKDKFKWNFIQEKDHHLPFIYSEVSGSDTIFIPVIKDLDIKNGKISIDSSGENLFLLDKMNCHITTKTSKLPSFKIDLKSNNFKLYHLQGKDIKGQINIKKSQIEIPNVSGKIAGGNFKVENLLLDPQKNILQSCNMKAKDIKAEKLFQLDNGKITGTINLNAAIDTSFVTLENLNSKGSLSIKDLKAEDIPLLKKVVKLTEIKSLRSISFEELKADFHAKDKKIISDTIRATGKDFSLSGSGYIKPKNQYFYYNVKGVFEPHMKDSMSTFVWEALLPMKDGRRYFKCLIEGTPKNPSVHLKREMVRSAAKSLFKSIKKDFKSLFK